MLGWELGHGDLLISSTGTFIGYKSEYIFLGPPSYVLSIESVAKKTFSNLFVDRNNEIMFDVWHFWNSCEILRHTMGEYEMLERSGSFSTVTRTFEKLSKKITNGLYRPFFYSKIHSSYLAPVFWSTQNWFLPHVSGRKPPKMILWVRSVNFWTTLRKS